MATEKLNALGMKCPQPILKVAALLPKLNAGDILETASSELGQEVVLAAVERGKSLDLDTIIAKLTK